ncbi:isochorismatase family protein [Aliamphritea spongicola]|uniref:isochorismatase family protein n=1 Tax=Aliamphritea spongicola TaxID=707589 RepID=UPI00196BA805|nr:isochorismatase family protein [Aliamphritea spongicola]MBN3562330.1 isochorismatase family protein [Aliamphritea spongicola]
MNTALLVIDVQMALLEDDNNGAKRSNPAAADNITRLLTAFREKGDVIVHVHHHGTDPEDPFFSEAPGAAVQPFAAPQGDEPVVIKFGSSAFVGTDLEQMLRAQNIERVVICGATANHCAESAARSASNLGFDTLYTADGVWAYEATGPDGITHSAETIHSVSLSTLQGEFADVLTTEEILAKV